MCPGEILGVRVDPKDKEWLRQQSGGLSFNTRRAIALYRKLMENPELLEKL
jgi:ABC-type branched-subunit amino acid transport system ATPase component